MLPLPLCAGKVEMEIVSVVVFHPKKAVKKKWEESQSRGVGGWCWVGNGGGKSTVRFQFSSQIKVRCMQKPFPHPHPSEDGAFCVTRFLINFEIKLFRRYPRSNVCGGGGGESSVYNPRHILCTTRYHHHHHHRMNLISFQNSFI